MVRDDKEQTIVGGSSDKNGKDRRTKVVGRFYLIEGSFERKSGCSVPGFACKLQWNPDKSTRG